MRYCPHFMGEEIGVKCIGRNKEDMVFELTELIV